MKWRPTAESKTISLAPASYIKGCAGRYQKEISSPNITVSAQTQKRSPHIHPKPRVTNPSHKSLYAPIPLNTTSSTHLYKVFTCSLLYWYNLWLFIIGTQCQTLLCPDSLWEYNTFYSLTLWSFQWLQT